MGVGVCLIAVRDRPLLRSPTFFGYFIEKDRTSFRPNPLKTPEHIAPVWYFTPLLRDPARDSGQADRRSSPCSPRSSIFFFLPWLDKPSDQVDQVSRGTLFVAAASWCSLRHSCSSSWAISAPSRRRRGARRARFPTSVSFTSRSSSCCGCTAANAAPVVHLNTLIVMVVLIAAADVIRFDPGKLALMLWSALIPIAYYVVFVLGPLVTSLNEPRPVPERVIYR